MITLPSGTILAHAYTRVVHGDRGDYVEMEEIRPETLEKPSRERQEQERRFPDGIFYHEWRAEGVKIYQQLRYVGYADYNPGMWYVAVGDVIRWLTTEDPVTCTRCRKTPSVYFVFGDNLIKRGKKGQAMIRDEPNSVGVPTKKAPSMAPGAFFCDSEYEDNVRAIETALVALPTGCKVLVPDGIGRFLARLPEKAPRTYAYLCGRLGLCVSQS